MKTAISATFPDAVSPAEAGDPCGMIEPVRVVCLKKGHDVCQNLLHLFIHERDLELKREMIFIPSDFTTLASGIA
jgi:hypothetical protein